MTTEPMLEVTIWDAGGNVVEHSISEAQTATDEQIADMVAMIEGGMPASLAARVAISSGERTK